jgi:hypothetical protein
MARRPVRFRNRSDLIKMTKGFLKNEQFINTLAAARTNRLGRAIKRLSSIQRTKQATDKFRNSRERGLSLRQLLDNVEPKIRKNSIRDKVTVINLKLTKDGQKILSRTLTYDKTKGKLQVRPHKHIITKLPSESERDNIKFARARRIKVSCDCLTGDTKVLTDKGWKTILELAEPYDPLKFPINYMYKGEKYKGTTPYYKGLEYTWTLHLSNGKTVTATKDHRFLKAKDLTYKPIFKRNKKGKRVYSHSELVILSKRKWIELSELKVGDRIIFEEYKPDSITWDKDFYEAFFVGTIMGDGGFFTNKIEFIRQPDLQLYKKHDREEIIKFLEKSNTVFEYKPMNTRDGLRVKFSNRALEILCKYKYINKESVIIQNRNQLLGYLSGLMVTDGSIGKRDATLHGGFKYLSQLQDYLIEYGYTSVKLTTSRESFTKTNLAFSTKDLYMLNIQRRTLNNLYDNIWLPTLKNKKLRKIVNSKQHKNREPAVKITSIKYSGKRHVYDITVPEINRFIIQGGIIAHNCEDFMFRHEYSLTHRWGASDIKFSNGEFPFDKNPGLAPTICKHLYVLLRYVRQNGM